MQGRFSGRLAKKEDEKRLAEECRIIAPYLGGVGKRGDKSRLTLAKIVRGIACGAVRKHCEDRETQLKVCWAWLMAIDPLAWCMLYACKHACQWAACTLCIQSPVTRELF